MNCEFRECVPCHVVRERPSVSVCAGVSVRVCVHTFSKVSREETRGEMTVATAINQVGL